MNGTEYSGSIMFAVDGLAPIGHQDIYDYRCDWHQ